MARRTVKKRGPKQVDAMVHEKARRRNIPTAELQTHAQAMEERDPYRPVAYRRRYPLPKGESRDRDEDLDPQIVWNGATITLTPEQRDALVNEGRVEIGDAQLVWHGKDTQDWTDLVVQTPPIYIQEKVHPKAIIDDLKRHSDARAEAAAEAPDLFADFNGIPPEARTEFYQHDQNWSNRMILGDSLQVMASLAMREGLHGKVQCIYVDPPYGIRFNSNWQVSTRSRDVKDGKQEDISREPEQVKAFRDTWKDGIHSYLTYLRDRLTVMRDLLTESGSIFVQIGDENVHRVRAVMDEVFGEENFVVLIAFQKTGGIPGEFLSGTSDYVLWYARNKKLAKYRPLLLERKAGHTSLDRYDQYEEAPFMTRPLTAAEKQSGANIEEDRRYQLFPLYSDGESSSAPRTFEFQDINFSIRPGTHWKTTQSGLTRLGKANRIATTANTIRYRRFVRDVPMLPMTERWESTQIGTERIYVVQTSLLVAQRCILLTSDPGDLVLDPTCGSGTTAYVAERWGRRWITIDSSRVALALARTRLMGARYPYYLLADSAGGRDKEAELTGRLPSSTPTHNEVRQGFVYERAPHITLKSIANNAEIDVIWETWQQKQEPLREKLNASLGRTGDRAAPGDAGKNGPWEEWEIPREVDDSWPDEARKLHAAWWEGRIARQKEIDDSIAQKADVEMLYDRPYTDNRRVRVAGPFTVESLSPHRMIAADEDDILAEGPRRDEPPGHDFAAMVYENLRTAGVHQSRKEDRISFESIEGWPGTYIGAEGRYLEGTSERRAAIFVGPEFGTITRADLTAAAREAADARFHVLVACGFAFDVHTSELDRLGPLRILRARMNPDLHMSGELKNTGKGNLFVVFGEPDIDWRSTEDGEIEVEVLGVDVFDPKTGKVRASGKDDIAAWFIDTDYDEESFFVRHAYFMGANDPYKSLKTALKAEIDEDAWATLYRDTSRPFPPPATGRFAVKVINHFGDEVMKVFGV